MKKYIFHPLFSDEIYHYFSLHFHNHQKTLQFFSETMEYSGFFFREILSGEYSEIAFWNEKTDEKNLQKLLFSIQDTKSELVPVLIFQNKNKNSGRIYLELHSEENPF